MGIWKAKRTLISRQELNKRVNMAVDCRLTSQDENNESDDGAPLFDLAGIKVMFFLVAPITQVRTKSHGREFRARCKSLLEAVRLGEG